MNRLWIIATFLCFIASAFIPLDANEWPEAKADRAERRVNRLSQIAIYRITRKYGVTCVGTGGAMPGGPILEVSLAFQTNKKMSKSHMRRLVLAFATEILEAARSIPDLNEYVAEPPFGIKNIWVDLFQSDRQGRPVVSPEFSVVGLSGGMVKFCIDDPEGKKFPFLSVERVTYQEALDAVRLEDEQASLDSQQITSTSRGSYRYHCEN